MANQTVSVNKRFDASSIGAVTDVKILIDDTAKLINIVGTGLYQSKTFNYDLNGNLIGVNVI